MSLHNRIDLIDALFQVALIDLGAGPPDCPPDSGGKCSITLVFWSCQQADHPGRICMARAKTS